MIWLLSWLFPLWVLLPKARKLGSVAFIEVAGVGWQCTIRPSHTGVRKRGQVNAWSAQAKTLGGSLREALAEAKDRPVNGASEVPCAPRLGGDEFDPE